MKKSLAASEEVNEDLLGELNSIRAELTNSMQDILMTRHIVAAVQVGHHDIAPWRGPPPSTSAGSGGEEEVAWQNVDQESFDDNGSRHGAHQIFMPQTVQAATATGHPSRPLFSESTTHDMRLTPLSLSLPVCVCVCPRFPSARQICTSATAECRCWSSLRQPCYR